MSDQETEALIFGNQNLPAGTADRPLVTFAVFAYNQEDFVRDAIESAFAQTYSPLEIILSDDCSADRTFQIMKELASAYSGPHRIVVRKNAANSGVLGHVLTVAKMARGEFLVVAAGDDISFPERTEGQVAFMRRATDSVVVVSSFDIVFDNDTGAESMAHLDVLMDYYSKTRAWFHGATACYRLSILRNLPVPSIKIYYEDMAFIAAFAGSGFYSGFMEKPAIRRRHHGKNIGMERALVDSWAEERRILQRIGRAADAIEYAADAVDGVGQDARQLRKRVKVMRQYANWPEMRFFEKVGLFLESLSSGCLRKSSLQVLLGKGLYLHLKSRVQQVGVWPSR